MIEKYLRNSFLLYIILFGCAFLFGLLFYQALSPLYEIETSDSSVFKLIGYAILQGKIPYMDIFDHKGPMLYVIEALGQWFIPGRWGLFMLSVISLFVCILYWYKSAHVILNSRRSFVIVILMLLTYYYYLESGNLSENWNLPFLSVSYYLLLTTIIANYKHNHILNGLMVGICMACSFFIRPNDAVAFIGAPITGVCIWFLMGKDYQTLLKWISAIIVGFVIISLCFVVWFAAHNALNDLWYGLLQFNIKYASGNGGILKHCFRFPKVGYLPFLITLILICRKSKHSSLLYIVLPSIIVGYLLLGTKAYLHYWITWIPVLFLSFWIFTVSNSNKVISTLALCIFLSMPIFSQKNWIKTPITMYREIRCNLSYVDTIGRNSSHLLSSIQECDRDSIWSYNLTWHGKEANSVVPNTLTILLKNDIVPCNRVPLIFMADNDTTLLKYMDLTNVKPKYILFAEESQRPILWQKQDSLYIKENYHECSKCDCPTVILYERN